MKVVALINSTVDTDVEFQNLMKEQKTYDMLKQMLYNNYYNNVQKFFCIIEEFKKAYTKHSSFLSYKTQQELFILLCNRMEQVECSIYKTELSCCTYLQLDGSYMGIEEIAKGYCEQLSNQYNALPAVIKEESKIFYYFKCDIIDWFLGLTVDKEVI